MHIVVSWDIAAGPKRSEIEQDMIKALGSNPWVRPLTTFYVIPANEPKRQAIYTALVTVAQSASQNVEFMVSPLMAGHYLGKHSDWETINKYTA